ncbi:MAG: phosphoenolpyruvate carboxylase [Acidobacteria bacterium 13_1_40CM_4_65_8]|nr:MAG: phosphoenolpyruvate carboxylase [Acidobacteria bacterium 13_1_40CM_4_65_8]
MSDPHQPLRDDVRLLGELLGQVLHHHEGPELLALVEEVRALSKSAHAGNDDDFDKLADLLRELPITTAFRVARAFAHFLTLANIAEQHHRVRRRREHARDARGRAQRGSCEDTCARLLAAGVPAGALDRAARSIRIELVLTAHPTEIVRRTLLQKHHRIAGELASLDRPDLTASERQDALDAIQREIASVWQTDEVRHERVSPLDEVRAGLVVFEESLWGAVPRFLRALDRALAAATRTGLPLNAAPVRFGSWIGGDRDGNPNITPEVTRQATWLARWMAASLYLREIRALRAELSLTTASDALRVRTGDAHEPYRALLAGVRDRLFATRAWAEAALASEHPERASATATAPYFDAAELLEPLALCYRSLGATGNQLIAAGRLADILRRLAVFGLTLARLDLRQEASRHTDAIEWIAQQRGWGPYAAAAEADRQSLLVRALTAGRTRLADLPIDAASEQVRDVLETFRMAATLHRDSLGAYVITMAGQPSDVLAVELLQRMAGQAHPQRVVPLFETADDLHRAGETIDALLRVPWYRERIRGHQEVMVGYSDSAKDAGRFAAAWILYRGQEDIISTCERHGVAVTLFHGRGGSIGRGGGPTYLAIQSQPPRKVSEASEASETSELSEVSDTSDTASVRITEQGETIEAKFGLVDIAVRTLEVYTSAMLEATVAPQPAPRAEWRESVDRVADEARAAYRAVVYETPEFLEYFRNATPEPELAAINIGSRPARRPGGISRTGGVESLRAIPWQFAWTQTRLLLPSWLGIEAAITEADKTRFREMYDGWPFFRSTLDLIAIALAEADPRIAAQYDRLVPAALRPLGANLRKRFTRASDAVLAVMATRDLLHDNPVLRRSIDVRNPYVDPINLVQIELLRRLRTGGASDPQLQHAFVVTVNGIAAGMRNTG